LGLEIRSDNPLPSLMAGLSDKQMLLVFDNCAHVIEAAASLAISLLTVASGVHILATSREPLRVEGSASIDFHRSQSLRDQADLPPPRHLSFRRFSSSSSGRRQIWTSSS